VAGSQIAQWPPREVTDVRRRLDELAALVETPLSDLPQDARDWLAHLLVVRSCGYVEQTVLSVGLGYLVGRSAGPARSFGQSWLSRGPNPTPEALTTLVARFDSSWSEELGELLEADDQRLHRELSFLVDRRNKIAHGLNEGLGVAKALRLRKVAYEVADWFVLRFNPRR
jgi:hypothetical protein